METINNGLIPEVPPNDYEAEQSVLSCMLFDNDGIATSYEILTENDFYRKEHQIIFNAICIMYEEGAPVDIVMLKNKLESLDAINIIGGYEYILELYNIVSTSVLTEKYASIVKEKSIRRKMLKASKDIQKLSFDNTKTTSSILEDAEGLISNISSNSQKDDMHLMKDILKINIEQIETLYRNKKKITGIETGFYDFDAKTAGLQNSDFILVAARPAMGKTAFVMNIAQYVAGQNGITTAIFSLEMSKEQLVNRMICSDGLIDSQKLKMGDLQSDDWNKIVESVSNLSNAPLYIDDKTSITMPELRAKCRNLKKKHNLGLIIIDYLQLMSSNGRTESRQQEIASISRSIKSLARELNVPIIALSQLSRAVELRKPPKPMLSDLRESGAIEQDADVVCFLYREEYYTPETERKGQADIIIAKQRNGAVGTISLGWHAKYTKFVNLDTRRTY